MSKQIRPLSAYKKAYREYYQMIDELTKDEATSKKGKENSWYWWYGSLEVDIGGDNTSTKRREDPFFFNKDGGKNNKGTVSELGRLLLTGWYYNIEDRTKEISLFVYRSYHKKLARGDGFNDLEFKEAVKHIRENIGYYYHNKEELKLYILETFFNSDLKPLLPEPPELLESHDKAIELLEELYKNKSKDWFKEQFFLVDSYWYYLSEILDSYDIPYFSLQEFKAKDDKEAEEYVAEIKQARNKYREKLKALPLSKYLDEKK